MKTETADSKDTRRRRSLFIKTPLTIKFTTYFMVFWVVAVSMLIVFEYILITDEITAYAQRMQMEAQNTERLQAVVWIFLSVQLGAFAILGYFILSFLFQANHQIYGPIPNIRSFIRELTEGNYSVRRTVRPDDALKPVMEDLNRLAESLERQHGRNPTTVEESS